MLDKLINCPWDSWTQTELPFCEEAVCGLIRHPADTWSNLIWIIFGIIMLVMARKNRLGIAFGAITIFLGLGSGFMHATDTVVGEFLDLFGMYLLAALIYTVNGKRVGNISQSTCNILYVALVVGGLTGYALHLVVGWIYFGSIVVFALIIEYNIYRRGMATGPYHKLMYAMAALLIGWGFWWLDLLRVWCVPENHLLTGHAVWHFFTAIAVFLIYLFYREQTE